MFLSHQPAPETVSGFIASQRELDFTYSMIGGTRTEAAPQGFNVDHNRIQLGEGPETFAQAVRALRSWQQFQLGWVAIVPVGVPLEVGNVVAVRARTFGFWSLSACRIVYTINEEGSEKKFGFAYGTLPDHVECGEERFTIEQQEDGAVFYDIFAFSRPRQPLVRLGFPLARQLQRRFARESLAKMKEVVM